MRFAVIGSRGFSQPDTVISYLNHLKANVPDLVIVSGGCKDSPDEIAEKWAAANGVQCDVYPADWDTHGESAGIKRNGQIIEASDRVLAFWDGESTGTLDSILRASKRKLPFQVVLA